MHDWIVDQASSQLRTSREISATEVDLLPVRGGQAQMLSQGGGEHQAGVADQVGRVKPTRRRSRLCDDLFTNGCSFVCEVDGWTTSFSQLGKRRFVASQVRLDPTLSVNPGLASKETETESRTLCDDGFT
jgi:hypothetical protein